MKTYEYDVEPLTVSIFEPIKIKVGPKVLRFTNKTAMGVGSISFQKHITNGQPDGVTIRVEHEVKMIIPKTCDMGHTHDVEEKIERTWETIGLHEEHLEQFVDWIQHSRWKPVRVKK